MAVQVLKTVLLDAVLMENVLQVLNANLSKLLEGVGVVVGVGVVDLEEVGLEEGAPLEVITGRIGHG